MGDEFKREQKKIMYEDPKETQFLITDGNL